MQSRKLFSVGFISVLVVLSAVSVGGLAGTGMGPATLAQSDTGADELQVNEDEPNDNRQNATPIELSAGEVVTASGAINDTVTDDGVNRGVDFFAFNATAGQAINLYPSAIASAGPTIRLYGPSGDVITEAETSLGDVPSIGGVAEETGTYYVRLNGSTKVQSPDYSFGIEIANPDPFEPNEGRQNATPVQPDERINGTILDGGDEDFFAIEADAGEKITTDFLLKQSDTDIPGDLTVDVFNADGERINENLDSGNRTFANPASGFVSVTVNATAEQAGTYYVRVQEQGPPLAIGGFVKYGLTVDTSGAESTTEEPTTAGPKTQEPTETTTEEPTTEKSTTQEPTTEEPTETTTEGTQESDESDSTTAYYQVDFVVGEPIENLRGPEGTYTNDQLIRFAHGSSDEPVTRRSDGEFITDDAMADRIESQNIEVANGTATTTFTVAEGESITLTLASYEKVGPGWSPQTESEQVFVDSETRTFESGTHTLTVDLPDEDLTGDSDDADAE